MRNIPRVCQLVAVFRVSKGIKRGMYFLVLIERQGLRSQHDPEFLPLPHAALRFQTKQIPVPDDPVVFLVGVKATDLAGVPMYLRSFRKRRVRRSSRDVGVGNRAEFGFRVGEGVPVKA